MLPRFQLRTAALTLRRPHHPKECSMRMMKTLVRVAGIGLFVASSAAVVSGCATGTENKRAEARGAAGSFRSSLGEMPGHIDRTMSKLMELSDNRSADKSKTLAD